MDFQANPFAAFSFIAAPAVLTNACSVLVLSTSNRLARAVDRGRDLATRLERPEALAAPQATAQLAELRAAERRMLLLIRALRAFYIALGSFATAALLSLVGAVLAPVVFGVLTGALEVVAIAASVAAVAALVRGALLLLQETRIAVDVLEERASRLRAEFAQRQGTPAGPGDN